MQEFSVPVPPGTESLTIVVYDGVLAILAQYSYGSLHIEDPIFEEKIDAHETVGEQRR